MLNVAEVKSDRDRAWETALSAKMNFYYHLKLSTRWGMFDFWSKIVLAVMAAVGALPGLNVGPKELGWVAFASALLGAIVVALRVDRKLSVHASLSARYLAYSQDLERVFHREDFSELERLLDAYNQTERFEAEQEGESDQGLLAESQARVLKEIGAAA
jgi:hypothetical protein